MKLIPTSFVRINIFYKLRWIKKIETGEKMTFRPKVNETIRIGNKEYKFTEHPSVKGVPYVKVGMHSFVYQIQESEGGLFALKVFGLANRSAQIEEVAEKLMAYRNINGLEACERKVIIPSENAELVIIHPELRYGVIMPWLEGETIEELQKKRIALTPEQRYKAAARLLMTLLQMKANGIAHCNINSSNLIVEADKQTGEVAIHLTGLEGMFIPGMNTAEPILDDIEGEVHPDGWSGIRWGGEADNYAGSMLLGRILSGNTDPSKVDSTAQIKEELEREWGERIGQLYERAVFGTTPDKCPSFTVWMKELDDIGKRRGYTQRESEADEKAGIQRRDNSSEGRGTRQNSENESAEKLAPVTGQQIQNSISGDSEKSNQSNRRENLRDNRKESTTVSWGWMLCGLILFVLIKIGMNNLFGMENSNIKIFGMIPIWALFAYEIILAGYFLSVHKLDDSLSIQKQVPAYLWFAIIYISIEYLCLKSDQYAIYSDYKNNYRIIIYLYILLIIILIMRQINKNEDSQKSSLSGIRKTINIIISLIILFIVSNTMYIIDFSEFVNNQTLILPQPFSQDKKIVIPAESTLGVAYESFLNYYVYNSSYNSLKIKAVFPGSSAEEAGLKAGDQIIDIEGKPITTIEEMAEILASHPGEEIGLSYIRDGVLYHKRLTPNLFDNSGEAKIGVQVDLIKEELEEDFYIKKKFVNKK